MVCKDALLKLGIEAGERLQHVGPASRVGGDRTALGGSESLDVVDDVEERLVDLADVVEQGDTSDPALLVLAESRCVGEDERVFGDTSDVYARVGVVGVDSAEERFEGGGGHAFGGLLPFEFTPDEGGAGHGGDASCRDGSVGESHRRSWRQEMGVGTSGGGAHARHVRMGR